MKKNTGMACDTGWVQPEPMSLNLSQDFSQNENQKHAWS